MRKNRTIQYYTDPGHGWIKVSLKELIKLDIIEKISAFSYVNKGYAYLEEDLDAGIFIDTLKALGVTVKIKQFNSNKTSRIRGYHCFTTENVRFYIGQYAYC